MARALWTGAISFGLVNIPVKLYRATASAPGRSIQFHLLHKTCGTRIKNVRWCPKDDREVPWDEVAKGYEVEKGRYVMLSEADLDKLLPEDDYAAIAIESFVALDEVDPIFYDRAYYVAPEGSPKAYTLLLKALADSGRVAIARVTLRTRQHIAVVRAQDNHLLLSTMYFSEEIVDAGEVPALPEKLGAVDKKQEDAAQQLIDSMTQAFDPSKYHDEYAAKAQQVIEEKLEKGDVSEAVAPPVEEGGGRVINLLDALRKSVAAHKKGELPSAAEPRVVERGARRERGHARKGGRRGAHARSRAHAKKRTRTKKRAS